MTRNRDIKRILRSREIAKRENARQRERAKSSEAADNAYVRSSVWPTNKRSDKE